MDWNSSSMLMPAVAALLVALVATPVVRRTARRLGVLSYPDSVRRFHAVASPLWGGLAVCLAMLAGLAVALALPAHGDERLIRLCHAAIPAAVLACFFGAVDDRFDLAPRLKLLLQLLSVTPVVAAGYSIDVIVVFNWRIALGPLGIPVTVLWLLGCINALNLIDGMDGLASVVGLSITAMMSIIAVSTGNPHVAVVALALAGALAGFFAYNRPPASIFLGDSGSTMIGLVVGILGIQGSMKSSATLAITAPVVVMALPLYDVVMAMIRRKLTRRPLDVGDRQHIHHRLLDRGMGPWQVLCLIGALCLTTGAAATAATVFRLDALAWITTTTIIILMIRLHLFGDHEFGLVHNAIRSKWNIFARLILAKTRFVRTRQGGDLSDDPETAEKISSETHHEALQPYGRKAA